MSFTKLPLPLSLFVHLKCHRSAFPTVPVFVFVASIEVKLSISLPYLQALYKKGKKTPTTLIRFCYVPGDESDGDDPKALSGVNPTTLCFHHCPAPLRAFLTKIPTLPHKSLPVYTMGFCMVYSRTTQLFDILSTLSLSLNAICCI